MSHPHQQPPKRPLSSPEPDSTASKRRRNDGSDVSEDSRAQPSRRSPVPRPEPSESVWGRREPPVTVRDRTVSATLSRRPSGSTVATDPRRVSHASNTKIAPQALMNPRGSVDGIKATASPNVDGPTKPKPAPATGAKSMIIQTPKSPTSRGSTPMSMSAELDGAAPPSSTNDLISQALSELCDYVRWDTKHESAQVKVQRAAKRQALLNGDSKAIDEPSVTREDVFMQSAAAAKRKLAESALHRLLAASSTDKRRNVSEESADHATSASAQALRERVESLEKAVASKSTELPEALTTAMKEVQDVKSTMVTLQKALYGETSGLVKGLPLLVQIRQVEEQLDNEIARSDRKSEAQGKALVDISKRVDDIPALKTAIDEVGRSQRTLVALSEKVDDFTSRFDRDLMDIKTAMNKDRDPNESTLLMQRFGQLKDEVSSQKSQLNGAIKSQTEGLVTQVTGLSKRLTAAEARASNEAVERLINVKIEEATKDLGSQMTATREEVKGLANIVRQPGISRSSSDSEAQPSAHRVPLSGSSSPATLGPSHVGLPARSGLRAPGPHVQRSSSLPQNVHGASHTPEGFGGPVPHTSFVPSNITPVQTRWPQGVVHPVPHAPSASPTARHPGLNAGYHPAMSQGSQAAMIDWGLPISNLQNLVHSLQWALQSQELRVQNMKPDLVGQVLHQVSQHVPQDPVVSELRRTLTALMNKVDNYDNERGDLVESNQEAVRLGMEATRRIGSLEGTTQCLGTTVRNLETAGQAVQTTVQSLETTVRNLGTAVQSVQTMVQSAENTALNLETRVRDLETTVKKTGDDHQTTVQSIDPVVREFETTVRNLETRVRDHETTLESIQTSVQPVEDTVQSLETRVRELETTAKKAGDDHQTTVQSIKPTVQELETTVRNLETQVRELENKSKKARDDHQTANKNRESLLTQVKQLQRTVIEADGRSRDLDSWKAEMDNQLEMISGAQAEHASDIAKHASDIADLRHQHEQAVREKRLEKLEISASDLSRSDEKIKNALREFRDRLENLEGLFKNESTTITLLVKTMGETRVRLGLEEVDFVNHSQSRMEDTRHATVSTPVRSVQRSRPQSTTQEQSKAGATSTAPIQLEDSDTDAQRAPNSMSRAASRPARKQAWKIVADADDDSV